MSYKLRSVFRCRERQKLLKTIIALACCQGKKQPLSSYMDKDIRHDHPNKKSRVSLSFSPAGIRTRVKDELQRVDKPPY